jgi:hypothetical protein
MPKNRLTTSKSFVPDPRADDIVRSAVAAIKGILPLEIINEHKRTHLSRMIWAITEAHGKYKTRFRSQGVLTAPDCKIQHEHVFTRKELISEIMKNPESCERILENAVACVVTEEEHRALTTVGREHPNLKGWDRYRQAGITVYDMLSRERYL